jgi:hypothetical protein
VADERINRSLDILHEHALKVLQTIDRTFAEIDEVVRGMSDDNISRNEVRLHDRLKRVVESLPQVQGIAIVDRDGHPLVSSNTLPVPKELNFSDRDYFKAQTGPNAGTYVSNTLNPRMGGIGPYFLRAIAAAAIGRWHVQWDHFKTFTRRWAIPTAAISEWRASRRNPRALSGADKLAPKTR